MRILQRLMPHASSRYERRPEIGDVPSPIVGADGRRIWRENPAALPWFDQSDALARVRAVAHRWGLGRAERAWLRKWVTDGYYYYVTNQRKPYGSWVCRQRV